MGAKSRIEWTDATWNPVMGCTRISEACRNCYALSMIRRFAGTNKGFPDDPDAVTLYTERLSIPLQWKASRRVFVCSMSDLFHDDVPDDFIREVFWTMQRCGWHTFMVLTKRPERMRKWFLERPGAPVLPNVWLGVTAENQARANERIPVLLSVPAAVHYVSVEPMLDYVDLSHVHRDRWTDYNALEGRGVTTRGTCGQSVPNVYGGKLDWVICGGETGQDARPMRPPWARSLRDQCAGSGVPFFFKSWGEWADVSAITQDTAERYSREAMTWRDGGLMFRIGKQHAGDVLDHVRWQQFPGDVR